MIRRPELTKFLPEELRDTPFAITMAEAFEEMVSDKVIDNANSLLRLNDASSDRKSISVSLTAPNQKVYWRSTMKPGTLIVAVDGNLLLWESSTTLQNEETGTLVDAVNNIPQGYINKKDQYFVIEGITPSAVNTVKVEAQFDSVYELDFELLTSLRKSLGLFIDATGFQDEDILRRAISDLPYFYQVAHSTQFVDYLSFVSNVRFKMSELYSRVNTYPSYGPLVEYEEMIRLGFDKWAHEATLPANVDNINPATVPDDVWYKTSLIVLQYDDEAFFKHVGVDINLFEKITRLFYQLAPAYLVLLTIQARRVREYVMKWGCTIRPTALMRFEGTFPEA